MFNANCKSQTVNRKLYAFTLVELLITIGVIAILATTSFLSVVNYKQRQSLGFATQEIVTVLRNAQDRSLAQEGGNRWGVYFMNSASGDDFYDLFTGISYASSGIVSRSVLPSGVQFTTPASGSNITVIFSPVTGLPDDAATVKISLVGTSTTSSTITVNSNGKIQY